MVLNPLATGAPTEDLTGISTSLESGSNTPPLEESATSGGLKKPKGTHARVTSDMAQFLSEDERMLSDMLSGVSDSASTNRRGSRQRRDSDLEVTPPVLPGAAGRHVAQPSTTAAELFAITNVPPPPPASNSPRHEAQAAERLSVMLQNAMPATTSDPAPTLAPAAVELTTLSAPASAAAAPPPSAAEAEATLAVDEADLPPPPGPAAADSPPAGPSEPTPALAPTPAPILDVQAPAAADPAPPSPIGAAPPPPAAADEDPAAASSSAVPVLAALPAPPANPDA